MEMIPQDEVLALRVKYQKILNEYQAHAFQAALGNEGFEIYPAEELRSVTLELIRQEKQDVLDKYQAGLERITDCLNKIGEANDRLGETLKWEPPSITRPSFWPKKWTTVLKNLLKS